MLSVEQPPEKRQQGCEIEEQIRLECYAFDCSESDEDTDTDTDVNQAEAKMSSVEGGRPSEEEEEEVVVLEEEYEEESEEEEEEGQKVEDDDFLLEAYRRDRNEMFKSAMNKPFMRRYEAFEITQIIEPIPDVFPKKRCDRFVQCCVSDHDVFEGSPIFDVFRVELYLRNSPSTPLSGKLYGEIVLDTTTPDNPHPISYFYVKKDNAIPFTLNPDKEYGTFSLPLSGPKTRPPVVQYCWLDLKFALKIAFEGNDEVEQYKDVFEEIGCRRKTTDLFDHHTVEAALICLKPGSVGYFPRPCSVQMEFLPYRMEDDYGMAAFHSAYIGAWATVGVEIKKKGLSGFYGFIFARSCVFPNSRMYLLSIDKKQKRELEPSELSVHPVVLTRKVVSAPTCSSLIIVAVLWDQDGESIVDGKTFFPAQSKGTFARFIGEKETGVGIDVKVKWRC